MSKEVLSNKSVLVIFATAPTGLGHLRVTNALAHGLPKDVSPLILGAENPSLSMIYRFISTHPLTRMLMERIQEEPFQTLFTTIYRSYLRSHTQLLYKQMTTILDERIDPPTTVLIVATHYELAHQIAQIKTQLEKEKGVSIILAVQVTDDSPQLFWYVQDADIIFSPSEYTSKKLQSYVTKGHSRTQFLVTPYPISPTLRETLTPPQLQERIHQANPENKSNIHISIPISGAAVGMEYVRALTKELHRLSDRFVFHIVAKDAPYTRPFLKRIRRASYAKVVALDSDRETVDAYETLYKTNILGFEITKPSEQAFKALFRPTQKGGSILLFSSPVGKQEYDNLNFLIRHRLLPSRELMNTLWESASQDIPVTKALLDTATSWRCLLLPKDHIFAAKFIWWCLENGLFAKMMHYTHHEQLSPEERAEIAPSGVAQFWEKVSEKVKDTNPSDR